jgi:RHS repeat-associated protein
LLRALVFASLRISAAAFGRSIARSILLASLVGFAGAASVALWRPVSASAALPSIEVEHMPEIEQWVYRNGATTNPLGCGEVCGNIWTAEHRLPVAGSATPLWDALGKLETSGTDLWGPLGKFREELSNVFLENAELRVGWKISKGTPGSERWMQITGPVKPSESNPSCSGEKRWSVHLKLPGEAIGTTFEAPVPHSPGNEWYLLKCETIELDWQHIYETAKPEGEGCGELAEAPPFAGWHRQEWFWNLCFEGFRPGGGEYLSDVYADAYYKDFHFSRPEDWSGQHLEGEATHNLETNKAEDPGSTAVKAATEAALEESTALRSWLQWVLEGERGSNPLSISPDEELGSANESAPNMKKCLTHDPVNCATGNETITQTDLSIGGRGPGLRLTRDYNALLAAKQTASGVLGYGWTAAYSARLELSEERSLATVRQDNGSTAVFARSGESWVARDPLVQSKLVTEEGGGYAFTLRNQTVLRFTSGGLLASETDRNGNAITIARNGAGAIESLTDPAGRKLSYAYNGEGLVESVKDPMGHTVKYAYEGGNLTSVTLPGEEAPRWRFKYDGSHRMTRLIDGRGGETLVEYDASNRVTSQTDPAGRTLTFAYEPGRTKVTNHATEAVTDEHFNASNEPVSITHGYGTSLATTQEDGYDSSGNPTSVTDGDKHATTYEYSGAGDRIKMVDPVKNETKWTYDGTHDVETITTPKGEVTTIKRDSRGNPESVSRPAPGSTTQVTTYKYDTHGQLESLEDPLKHVWKYGYDSQGDRTSETDPEGDKRTWGHDEDSRVSTTVSPRGNVEGTEASKYTTTTERDAQGRPLTITDALGRKTKYAYDANGNLESVTDANGHKTKYTYDAADEQTKVEQPNGTITETGYDGAGQVTSQTDGNKHVTKYTRNVLEQVAEVSDPLARTTKKEYDAAGNLVKSTDPAKRVTTNTYDAANRLKETTYSDGKTHAVQYEYDADGEQTKMIDGTGTSTYTYDQLARVTETKDGHGNVAKYEYDLANEQTKITYPNGKAVTRAYDKAGRLQKVTDWLEHTTTFAYNPDSGETLATYPAGTSNEDKYTYDEADQLSEVKMLKSSETLASLAYGRDNDGQVKSITSKGLPGEEKPSYEYDADNRLTKAGTTAYEYDPADNATKVGTSTNTFDNADELKTSSSATYSYDELGERTKRSPTSGAATTYGYNQAGALISVERPKEGKVAELKDSYAYDGSGLRTSQTISGTTAFLAWDASEGLPLLLNDGTNSYIYGPSGLPVEQINGTGTVLYLHHDQQGSTRMLTSATGKAEATYTYDAYGLASGTTGTATTPLGYDGQYTSSDTGLIYLRARTYDPSTAQFFSRDSLAAVTSEPYAYARDNPANLGDPSGLIFGIPGTPSWEEVGEGIAGWGDQVTLGATRWIREELGINNIDACSDAYQTGGLAGLVTGVLIPGEGEEEIGAAGASIGAKIARQMETRGWTEDEIREAIASGEQVRAVNKATGNPATRYVNPKTGQSVVVDDVTKEVIHVGGPGFKYGPGSGDLP